MIRVDRARVTAPRTLKSKAAAAELARAGTFHRRKSGYLVLLRKLIS
jgi:hypothetical protein